MTLISIPSEWRYRELTLSAEGFRPQKLIIKFFGINLSFNPSVSLLVGD
jgi:hypothetical protein